MIQEVRILGLYMPAALAWAVVALIAVAALRRPLHRLPLHRLLWRPALADLALFAMLWWGVTAAADRLAAGS